MALGFPASVLPTCQSLRVELSDATSVGAARRACEEMAIASGLDDAQRGRLGLIITEAAQNAFRYAEQAEIVLRRSAHAVDVLVLDKGPGMHNLERCMEDGFSTGGTRGAGLSSLQRQADVFSMHSQPGRGTGIYARVGKSSDSSRFTVGAVCLPVSGETACGDAWGVCETGAGVRLLVADGLGHGPKAAEASHAVLDTLPAGAPYTQEQALMLMHNAAVSTRGAAVAMADIALNEDATVSFMGVGNIGGHLASTRGESRSMASHNGTVGARISRKQAFVYPWTQHDALLIMYSDGLQSRWSLDTHPGLADKHPALVAGILYRDYSRGRDDVTVVVLKKGGQ